MIYAKYTAVLKNLMDDPEVRKKIDAAMSTYPLYEKKSKEEFIPAYIPTREQLNEKILRHYKYREIHFDTVGRFLDELEAALIEIMPRYNLLFMTADQDFNIIFNVDYQRTIDRQQEGTTEGSSSENATGKVTAASTGKDTQNTSSTAEDSTTTGNEVESTSKNVKTTTPQGNTGVPASQIDNVGYADEVNWGKDNSTSSGTSTSNGTTTATGETNRMESTNTDTENSTTGTTEGSSTEKETTLETTKGNFGVVSAQDLILKYRETIINIEKMIIEDPEISNLFMLVY